MNNKTSKQNIRLDFTSRSIIGSVLDKQEVAIMPAWLAVRLLKDMADELIAVPMDRIIEDQVTALRAAKDMQAAINASIEFAQMRHLVENVAKENWEVFTIPPEPTEAELKEEAKQREAEELTKELEQTEKRLNELKEKTKVINLKKDPIKAGPGAIEQVEMPR